MPSSSGKEVQQQEGSSSTPSAAASSAVEPYRRRSWSQLPYELGENILQRLCIADYLKMGAACGGWRSIQRSHLLQHRPSPPPMLRLPWIIPSVSRGLQIVDALSPFEPQPTMYPFFPGSNYNNRLLIAASHGWFLLLDTDCGDLCIVNPISGAEIRAPSPTGTPESGLLSAPPSHPDGFAVMLRLSGLGPQFIFWRPGDINWTVILESKSVSLSDETRFCMLARSTSGDIRHVILRPEPRWISIVHCGGNFYIEVRTSRANRTLFCFLDAHHPAPVVQILEYAPMPRLRGRADSLVDLDGQLILVRALVVEDRRAGNRCCIRGFELFSRADQNVNTWVTMEVIGPHAIFISRDCSFSLLTDEGGAVQSNFVYFLGEEASAEQMPMWIGYDLRTRTVMQGALSPLNAAGYERSMFRGAVLQWMMPELGVVAVESSRNHQADTGSDGNPPGSGDC